MLAEGTSTQSLKVTKRCMRRTMKKAAYERVHTKTNSKCSTSSLKTGSGSYIWPEPREEIHLRKTVTIKHVYKTKKGNYIHVVRDRGKGRLGLGGGGQKGWAGGYRTSIKMPTIEIKYKKKYAHIYLRFGMTCTLF